MKNNIYKQLSSIDIKGKVEKKGKHDYMSWATAWHLIKSEYPEAQRKVYECEETGLNFFTDGRTAYVKVGIIIEGVEHVDYLPVMDFRNKSILLDKVTSMDINTTIQRSTAKAIAMHGLGLSLWIGEDLNKVISEPMSTPKKVEKTPPLNLVLDIGDENWAKVLKFVGANKELGLPKIVKTLEQKYSIKAMVKKELSKHV
jgi:hypothetical protein|tara:strand:+ start:1062 stop:1661 length:600 start_codon:yes stop_codon:yes gene_type:complete